MIPSSHDTMTAHDAIVRFDDRKRAVRSIATSTNRKKSVLAVGMHSNVPSNTVKMKLVKPGRPTVLIIQLGLQRD